MLIQADRVLVPADSSAVRHLAITLTAPGTVLDAAQRRGPGMAARDVVVELTCPRGVELTVLNATRVQATLGYVRVRLGDLAPAQEVTLAVAASCGAQPLGTIVIVEVTLSDRDAVLPARPVRVEWRAVDPLQDRLQPVNDLVLVTVASVLSDRARVTAQRAAARGDELEARRVLRDVIAHLLGLAPGNRRILALIDSLRKEELRL